MIVDAMSLRVLYDYQIFALQEMGGISRYFVELARRLPLCEPGIETTVLAPAHINAYLDTSPVQRIGIKIASFPGKHHILPFVNRLVGQPFLKRRHPDIFHETYYCASHQLTDAPRILTVYDMIHERFPDRFEGVDRHLPALKAKAVTRADHVIAISESTRNDLMQYLDVPAAKISVIPLGSSFDQIEGNSESVRRERPYLLYVGLRGGVKNFQAFINAYSRSKILTAEFEVLCVGGGDFTAEEQQSFIQFGLRDRIRHLQADDGVLAALYKHAAVFVYPSLYEGFGMPLLEAMHFGCPVVCSNAGSMPEIARDAALYFDPTDKEHMQEVMETVVQSQETTKALRARGYEREKMFSWDKCVTQTAALYRSML